MQWWNLHYQLNWGHPMFFVAIKILRPKCWTVCLTFSLIWNRYKAVVEYVLRQLENYQGQISYLLTSKNKPQWVHSLKQNDFDTYLHWCFNFNFIDKLRKLKSSNLISTKQTIKSNQPNFCWYPQFFFQYWPSCQNGPKTEILYHQKPLNAGLGI